MNPETQTPTSQRKRGRPRGKRPRPQLEGYRPQAETARRLGVSEKTLRGWVRRGIGPARIKYGKTVLFSDQAIEDFLQRHVEEPVRLAEKQKRR